jgi:Spy/CpxP family protein refolding chaperone
MKKRVLIFGGVAALVVLLAVPFAFAQHMRHARGMAMHGGDFGSMMMLGRLQHAQQALGLSDQQVADIKTIFQDLRTQNQAYREQIHGGLTSVAQALIANPNDNAGAQALLEKQESAEHAMKLNALNAAAKALNVLTPDQRTKLSEHIQEHAGRHFEK